MKDFDVIVVGGGPAGLGASQKCAELGLKTIVLEKDQELGTPKRCGEGLGLGWFKRLNITPSKEWAVREMFGALLVSPTGKKVEVRFDATAGYILERKMFEKFLAREAARKGVKIQAKTTVNDVIKEDGRVVGVKATHFGEEFEVRSNVVIAADGVESRIARLAGMNTTNALSNIDAGFQYEMAGIDYEHTDLIHLYFGEKVAPRGYVWIFPKGDDYANVGVGIHAGDPETAKSYLDRFIEARPGLKKGSIIEVNAGSIPVGGFLEKQTSDGLVVVGDSAHHVNPIHGGGMGIAIEAGRLAAEVIKEAHEAEDFSDNKLHEYTDRWYEKRGNELKNILKKRYLLEKMTDKDFELIAGSWTGEEVMKLASSEIGDTIKMVTRKLVRHPGLLKIMLKYLK